MLNFGRSGRGQVPFVPASELNECGLACLAAISAFFDGETGLTELRELAVPSGRGESMLELRNLAERIGLSARGVKVEVKSLAQLALPAILHWEMNHFVVLERVTPSGIVIMDPAAGRLAVPWATVDTSFTGVALETRVSPNWRKARRWKDRPGGRTPTRGKAIASLRKARPSQASLLLSRSARLRPRSSRRSPPRRHCPVWRCTPS